MAITLDGTSGVTTPGVVNTAGETIATTLSVTGVTTLTGGLNAALPVLSGGTGVTTKTGTGSVVLNTAPTFSGSVVIDTLKTSTGTLATQNGMAGIHKAWINFNAASNTTAASFNVSSTTLVSTGISTISFTTALGDTNYTVAGMGVGGSTGACIWGVDSGANAYTGTPTLMTTTQVKISSRNDAGSLVQMGLTMIQIIGN